MTYEREEKRHGRRLVHLMFEDADTQQEIEDYGGVRAFSGSLYARAHTHIQRATYKLGCNVVNFL